MVQSRSPLTGDGINEQKPVIITSQTWNVALEASWRNELSLKADVDRLGFQSVFRVQNWCKNWILRCADLAVDRNAWTAAIRDIQKARLFSRRSYLHTSKVYEIPSAPLITFAVHISASDRTYTDAVGHETGPVHTLFSLSVDISQVPQTHIHNNGPTCRLTSLLNPDLRFHLCTFDNSTTIESGLSDVFIALNALFEWDSSW